MRTWIPLEQRPPTKQVSIIIKKDLYENIKELAESTRKPMRKYIEAWLSEGYAEHQKGQKNE